jgi:hypothetical protein
MPTKTLSAQRGAKRMRQVDRRNCERPLGQLDDMRLLRSRTTKCVAELFQEHVTKPRVF